MNSITSIADNPAKTIDEMPPEIRLRIVRKSDNIYDICLDATDNTYFRRYGAQAQWVHGVGLIEVFMNLVRIEPKIFCIHSRASKGYGPLIYDIAMEFATSMDCQLVSGSLDKNATAMSYEPAYKVWTKYLERSDVQRTPLTDSLREKLQRNMTKYKEKRDPTPFMYSYQKQPKLLYSKRITYNYVQFAPYSARYLKSIIAR